MVLFPDENREFLVLGDKKNFGDKKVETSPSDRFSIGHYKISATNLMLKFQKYQKTSGFGGKFGDFVLQSDIFV